MKLAEFDSEQAVPWAGGGKIPWHDPAFSGRMLREHLSQEHDRASRRFEAIEKHVSWIHGSVKDTQPLASPWVNSTFAIGPVWLSS